MTSHNKPVSTIIEKANRTSCHRKNFICKHVEILILLRRLLQSENLNSPTAQTVGLSLYTMLAKFQKSAYCLQSSPFPAILNQNKTGATTNATPAFLCHMNYI